MPVTDSERPPDAPDEQRGSLRRALVWGLIGIVVIVGVLLYFRYARTVAPLVPSQGG